ncbi:PASTA domain-containing protein [Phytohabitans houttuyneae]|uniref:PASTA domain-containing protein n=1 Tax=Phytohabitans houttuyneae TaxID=1076126 RepID=UPI0015631490|nr:PASTA domain-containing protein [Phytohabitans houttuyneae]
MNTNVSRVSTAALGALVIIEMFVWDTGPSGQSQPTRPAPATVATTTSNSRLSGATSPAPIADSTAIPARLSTAHEPTTMPGVTGARLTDAYSQLSAAGFTNITTKDATGKGRVVVNSTNWIVRSQSPKAGAQVDRGTAITLTVSKPSDMRQPTAPSHGVIPDVVCSDLQAAQDALQSAGFSNLNSQDGTGQGRSQVIDRNWVVTDQSATPGSTPPSSTRIVLTVVKYGEPTGDSGCPS